MLNLIYLIMNVLYDGMDQYIKRMIKGISLVLSLALVFAIGCEQNEKTGEEKSELKSELDSLKSEIVTAHDSAMVKMDLLMRLSDELKAMNVEGEDSIAINRAILDLDSSHDQMMDWMRGFSANFPVGTLTGEEDDHQAHENHDLEQDEHRSGIHQEMGQVPQNKASMHAALKEELLKIREVGSSINQSIDVAENLLSNQ